MNIKKVTKQNTKCESRIFKIDKRYTAANTNTLLPINVMESESPSGFERVLQNFAIMTWEYYGNEEKQRTPHSMFATYILWWKGRCRTLSITNTPCLQHLMHNITTSQEHNAITACHNWTVPKVWSKVHWISMKRPSVTSVFFGSVSAG